MNRRTRRGSWRVRASALAGIVGIAVLAASLGHAESQPAPGRRDPRIRTVLYNARDVVRLEVYYGYQTTVEFGEDELIQTTALGDAEAWSEAIDGAKRRIFLKPKKDQPNTNLLVVTTKRSYMFSLIAKQPTPGAKKLDSGMTWALRFIYPDVKPATPAPQTIVVSAPVVAPPTPTKISAPTVDLSALNSDYSYAGSRALLPTHLFDDGTATYFRFDGQKELPAIFVVNDSPATDAHCPKRPRWFRWFRKTRTLPESIANYQIEGRYVVVKRVASRFSLRVGDELTCVYRNGGEKGSPVNGPRAPKVVETGSEPGITASALRAGAPNQETKP